MSQPRQAEDTIVKAERIPTTFIEVDKPSVTEASQLERNVKDKRKNRHFQLQKGLYQRWRTTINALVIMVFLLLPFVKYQGQQAILFDLSQQQFRFFGVTLWPQDFTLMAWVFIIAAFLLFLATVIWGRVWCGYLCPQTSFCFSFVWVEQQIEGNRNKRHALDKAPWTLNKLIKRIAKHSIWGLMSLVTGCGFIAYFVPATSLYMDIFTLNASGLVTAWVWFFAVCTYLNAGFMREKMCLHCCPYARFQSAMFDSNTITVTYDTKRGESRGPRKRKQPTSLGDCVDCNLCVDVCPTGIDIRNGLQYECINCGACVDACNQTMIKFGYQPNLIGYFSENKLLGKRSGGVKSWKFVGYAAGVLAMVLVFTLDAFSKTDIELNVLRDRQHLYREVSEYRIENTYTLVIRNKTQQDKQYFIYLDKENGLEINRDINVEVVVKAGELLIYPVTLFHTRSGNEMDKLKRMSVMFNVTNVDEPRDSVAQQSQFFTL
ncbi:cytochrome c oxidase accessory protein CcoG [Shewanella maritima]|uniref:cytochrome c oxidase accessory protein CcoG n=1 Tax=Shewanella maritima TaxID=2520507 RepID=UPI0037369218